MLLFPCLFQLAGNCIPLFHHTVQLGFQFLMLFVERHIRSALRCSHFSLENGNGRFRLLYLRLAIRYTAFQFLKPLIEFFLFLIRKLRSGRLCDCEYLCKPLAEPLVVWKVIRL